MSAIPVIAGGAAIDCKPSVIIGGAEVPIYDAYVIEGGVAKLIYKSAVSYTSTISLDDGVSLTSGTDFAVSIVGASTQVHKGFSANIDFSDPISVTAFKFDLSKQNDMSNAYFKGGISLSDASNNLLGTASDETNTSNGVGGSGTITSGAKVSHIYIYGFGGSELYSLNYVPKITVNGVEIILHQSGEIDI